MATAMFSGSEIDVMFTARAVKVDYGVPRSPVWTEFEDVEIAALNILGVEVKPSALPVELVNVIYELADECEFRED